MNDLTETATLTLSWHCPFNIAKGSSEIKAIISIGFKTFLKLLNVL